MTNIEIFMAVLLYKINNREVNSMVICKKNKHCVLTKILNYFFHEQPYNYSFFVLISEI